MALRPFRPPMSHISHTTGFRAVRSGSSMRASLLVGPPVQAEMHELCGRLTTAPSIPPLFTVIEGAEGPSAAEDGNGKNPPAAIPGAVAGPSVR